jgi:hypothetical protein
MSESQMSDADDALRSLRERLAGSGDDRLGKALSELLENPLFTGAVTCAFDARELAVHAQEMAMAVLNIPSAADIERLTRRLRAMSQRLEGVEDALFRMEGVLAGGGVEARLAAIEDRLAVLLDRLAPAPPSSSSAPRAAVRPAADRASRQAPTEPADPTESPGESPAAGSGDERRTAKPPGRSPRTARGAKAKGG